MRYRWRVCKGLSFIRGHDGGAISQSQGSRLGSAVLAHRHSGREALRDIASRADGRTCGGAILGDGVRLVADPGVADPVVGSGVACAVGQRRRGVSACVVCRDGGGHHGGSRQVCGGGRKSHCAGRSGDGAWGGVRKTIAKFIVVRITVAIAVVNFVGVGGGDAGNNAEDTKSSKN